MPDQLSADLASLRISRNEPPAPRKGLGTIVTVLLVLAALAGAYVVVAPMVTAKLFKTEVSITEVSSVSPAQASIDVTSTGYVIPQSVAKVQAKIIGRVVKVAIREGETVKAGQLLFELDPVDQKSAIATAQAKVAAANAKVLAAKANLAEIDLQWERQKKIVATGAMAAATAEDLGARVKALQEQVKASEAEVAAFQAEVANLSSGLRNHTITSPIDGTALTKPAQLGDVANPGFGGPLVELADFSTLLVETDVPEARLGLIKVGGPCEVILDSAPSKRYRGSVVDVAPRINRAKATGTVKVRLLDQPERISPEMSARVSFLTKELDAAQMKEPPKIILPASAVVDRGGGKAVFVVDPSGKVRMTPVTLGSPFGTGFEVKDGPPPGTRLVNNPPPKLEDGQSIKERSS